MHATEFRFLVSADWRLHQPLSGVSEVPTRLRELFIHASYQAAESFIDQAIDSRVDFVLLVGDLYDPAEAGARAPLFLETQFLRLDRAGIGAYWVTSDSGVWSRRQPLPGNLVLVGPGETAEFSRSGCCLAQISLAPRTGESTEGCEIRVVAEPDAARSIPDGSAPDLVVARADCRQALTQNLDPSTNDVLVCIAQALQGLQGDRNADSTTLGSTLVDVDEAGRITFRHSALDVLRWHSEHVRIAAPVETHVFATSLAQRARRLSDYSTSCPLLVRWTIAGPAHVLSCLHPGQLLETLRSADEWNWHVDVTFEPHAAASPVPLAEQRARELAEMLEEMHELAAQLKVPMADTPEDEVTLVSTCDSASILTQSVQQLQESLPHRRDTVGG